MKTKTEAPSNTHTHATMENDGKEAIGLKLMAWTMYAVLYGLYGLLAIQILKVLLSLLV